MLGLSAACLVLGVWLAAQSRDALQLRHANERGAGGDLHGALQLASQVRPGPYAGAADRTRAYALVRLGRDHAARTAFGAAIAHSPNDWVLRRDFAALLAGLGERLPARRQMERALALNPYAAVPPGFVR